MPPVGTTTLATALAEVRSLLAEPNPAFWSDDELTNWINEACADMNRYAEIKQGTAAIPSVVNQQAYTAPSDAIRIHKVQFAPEGTPNSYTLEFRGIIEMDQIWGINQTIPGNWPQFYATWGTVPELNLLVYPVPSTMGYFNLWYYQQAISAVETTDYIDCVPGYEDLVYDYACYKAWRKDGDVRWKDSKADYMELREVLRRNAETWQDQGNYFTTGPQQLPSWLTSFDSGGW
jgi:hypothetical protein